MSTALKQMTVDEFLSWAEGREGRWELHDGVPVMMSPERARSRSDANLNAAIALQKRFARRRICHVRCSPTVIAIRIATKDEAYVALREAIRLQKLPAASYPDGLAMSSFFVCICAVDRQRERLHLADFSVSCIMQRRVEPDAAGRADRAEQIAFVALSLSRPRRAQFEPDASVVCGPPRSDETIDIDNPIIVVEVLSPSTAAIDHGRKLSGYFSLPSVEHYLILDPERRVVIHHKRGLRRRDRDPCADRGRRAARSAGI